MTTSTTPPYTPDDTDSARPDDLNRRHTRPTRISVPVAVPGTMTTSPAPRAWPDEDPTAGAFHYIGAALTPLEFRDYALQYYYGAEPPTYWIWHHTVNPDISTAPANPANSATWWDRNEAGMTLEQKKAKRKPQLDAIMRYYRDSLGWTVGPHLFTDDLFIWLFTPMYYPGIHANEGNSYTKNGVLRYSIGCEVIGYYDHYVWAPAVRAIAGWACACVKAARGIQNVYTPAGQDQPWLHDPQLSGHRDYTTAKTCPGAMITSEYYVKAAADGWAAYQSNTVPGGDPLRAATIPGPNGAIHYCGSGFYNYYYRSGRNGFSDLGYALSDETADTDSLNRPCTVMTFERGVLKYVEGSAVQPALLTEIMQQGWLP